jgi:hypothetical protein
MPTPLAAVGITELRKIFRSSVSSVFFPLLHLIPCPTKGEMTAGNYARPSSGG